MNITYLFGAGASKNAIPINDELMFSMRQVYAQLYEDFDKNVVDICTSVNPNVTKSNFQELLTDFKAVLDESGGHYSIDTFAKKLYIRGDNLKLRKLKTILSIYFIIIQSKNPTDKRYDSFFASILEEKHTEFPQDLKIVSWNYDYQFEKAYAEYSMDNRLQACSSTLNIYAKNSGSSSLSCDSFGILKLNGTATFFSHSEDKSRFKFFEKVDQIYDKALLQNIISNYYELHLNSKYKDLLVPSLSFAWEDYNFGKQIIENAIKFVEKTEILVVIGYSFPFFNRKADRDIIRSMSGLRAVYFQAPDAENLRERFLAIRDDLNLNTLLIRKDVGQFVFPNEF